MSHTTNSPDADCLGGQRPTDATRSAERPALRRATRTLQYFPYTDLTVPPENAKNSGRVFDKSAARSDVPSHLGVEEGILCPEGPACRSEIHPFLHQRRVRVDLLPCRRAQAVPGIAHLMVVDLRRIVRGVEAERLDVEAPGGAEQRIGGDHAVALCADQ